MYIRPFATLKNCAFFSMSTTGPLHAAVALGVGLIGGAINAVAAGGTLVTFPALIWLGLNSVTANATSTVALWPFVLGGMFGYRRELRTVERHMLYLVMPSLLGGLGGAILLRSTPSSVFDRLVPYLILFATLLFMLQEVVQRRLKPAGPVAHRSMTWLAGAMLFQLMVAFYGGYFGAGIGILMLAALSVLGMTNIHQMIGLKNIMSGTINGVAAIYFIAEKMVSWPDVSAMAAGAIAGGYFGARVARWMGVKAARRIVIVVGFGMTLALFIKR
jgi:uncharacterized membrane protein YfcA